jgi:hypothetical protein
VLVHTDMALPHLLNSGTPEQLERWLPPVPAGETMRNFQDERMVLIGMGGGLPGGPGPDHRPLR